MPGELKLDIAPEPTQVAVQDILHALRRQMKVGLLENVLTKGYSSLIRLKRSGFFD